MCKRDRNYTKAAPANTHSQYRSTVYIYTMHKHTHTHNKLTHIGIEKTEKTSEHTARENKP